MFCTNCDIIKNDGVPLNLCIEGRCIKIDYKINISLINFSCGNRAPFVVTIWLQNLLQ